MNGIVDEAANGIRPDDDATVDRELAELGRSWTSAEMAKDQDTLAALAHPDFRLVGPLGFVLDRDAWLQRYQPGRLDTTELDWDDVSVTTFDDTAVSIGRLQQRASYQGHPSDGEFRVTHVFVRDPDARFGWLIARMHLSPIAQPPGGGAQS